MGDFCVTQVEIMKHEFKRITFDWAIVIATCLGPSTSSPISDREYCKISEDEDEHNCPKARGHITFSFPRCNQEI